VLVQTADTLKASKAAPKVVLVVDDEPMVRMLAVDLFEELGCTVVEAAGGNEALGLLEARPDISLMFTDCRMPGMSGPELAQVASERWPNLRIVLVTGYHNVHVPGFPIVWKPYDQRTLQQVFEAEI
jgi:CheY-like chemotaxis protein